MASRATKPESINDLFMTNLPLRQGAATGRLAVFSRVRALGRHTAHSPPPWSRPFHDARRRRLHPPRRDRTRRRTARVAARSFDHLVSAGEERRWHREAKGFGGVHVDDQLDLGSEVHRQLGGLLALENAASVSPDSAVALGQV